MGLYNTVKDNNISFSLHHTTSNNSFLYFDAIEAITHYEKLYEGIKETNTEVTSIYNLLDYFCAKHIISFLDVIPLIKDESQKGNIKTLCSCTEELLKKYKIGDIIKFVNKEYTSLFNEGEDRKNNMFADKRKLFFPLVEFCISYQNGISDSVFSYLADNKWFIYINYYGELKSKLMCSWELFDKVFSQNNILNILRTRCEQIILIAKSIMDNSSIGNDFKNTINDRMFSCVIDLMKKAEDRETIAYGDTVRRIRRYFAEINYDQEKLREFENVHKEFESKLENWMKKNESVFSQKIPSDIFKTIFNSNEDWIKKLLFMTHKLEDKEIKSQFSFSSPQDTPLIDMVSHNIDTDDYFSFSRQHQIQIAASLGGALIMQAFEQDDYINNLIDWVGCILGYIADHCKFQGDDLFNDYNAIIQSLKFVDVANKKQIEGYGASLIYGSCILISACIEKLLRLIYKYESKIVLSDELYQLGKLINNTVISRILTEDLMKGIGFYLSKYGYIGLNYRNRLAHLSEIFIDEISHTLPYTFFYLYICIINGTFIYYAKDSVD